MTVLAHIAGVPVEEFFPTAAGAGTVVVLARSWVSTRRAARKRARRRA
jgi:hypothetical protein